MTYHPSKGVIVATNEKQEWMLPWWFGHFAKSNPDLPVTVVDLGLSESAKLWCERKASLLSFTPPKDLIINTSDVSDEKKEQWAKFYPGDFTPSRNTWFLKPFIFEASPYEHSIWIDIDCEVRKSIMSLFTPLEEGYDMAIVRFTRGKLVAHNSGVVAFTKKGPHLKLWQQNTYLHHQDYLGDENILLQTLKEHELKVAYFSNLYNWPSLINPIDESAAIIHHIGEKGKRSLLQHWNRPL